jgi:RHS repeat-associated protein
MTSFQTPRFRFVSVFIAVLCLLSGLASGSVSAQSSTTDGTTPTGAQPGAPAGSYSLSGFDTVNYFNGNLNFSLPLLQMGGRGGTGLTIPLRIERKWVMFTGPYYLYARNGGWQSLRSGYGAGTLEGRLAGGMGDECAEGTYETLLRLTFTAPDGTEYELRDTATNGANGVIIYGTNCFVQSTTERGRVFKSSDGTAVTFVSDVDITDANNEGILPTGYMLMPDGGRYRVVAGKVMWMRDRNGNRTEFEYTNNRTTKITDSLGRSINISYRNTAHPNSDEISYAGISGVPRTIRIWYEPLHDRLHTGNVIKTLQQLFPELNSPGSSVFDPDVVASVELPHTERYRFKYNSHGELARVILPTGGAVEYDHDGGLSGGTASGVMTNHGKEIYRRVVERRVYPDGGTGSAYASRMTISKPETTTGAPPDCVVVEHKSAAGALLAKEQHYYYGSAAGSFGQDPFSYSRWKDGKEWKSEVFDTNGTTVLRRVEHTWQQPLGNGTWPLAQAESSNDAKANDPQITQTVSTLEPGGANLVSKQTFAYDRYSNRTDTYEYGFWNGTAWPLIRRSTTSYLTVHPVSAEDYASQMVTAASIHLRNLPTQSSVYDALGVEQSRRTFEYDNYATDPNHAALVARSGITGLDAAFTSSHLTRGNMTAATAYLLTNGTVSGAVKTYAQYDVAGNAVKAIDGRGLSSSTVYTDNFSDGVGRNTYAYPTQSVSAIPDPSNVRATNTPLESWTAYDFSTGKITSSKDANNQVTTLRYDDGGTTDALDRLRKVEYPDGGWVKYFYTDTPGSPYVRTLTAINASQSVETYGFFDGLGRPVRSFVNEGGSPVKFLTTDTQYDALGRAWRVSNPYRANGTTDPVNPSGLWTTTAYDALGRVKMVTTPDGAHVDTNYSGTEVTVADQMGKRRRSVSDALGRLSTVYEDPSVTGYTGLNYQTNYTYDVLGNLRKVDQGGQLRYFMYDSLGRLIRAKNPEQNVNSGLALQDSFKAPGDAAPNSQWTMSYAYDNNGNLSSRTDARNVTTAYEYDQINRLKQTTYSDGTPYTLRTYDFAPTNGRGRFYADYESSTTGTLNFVLAYDTMGRATSGKTEFYLPGTGWLPAYTSSREYDKMGHVTKQTYPSGRVVDYTQFDAAGRLKELTGNLGDGIGRTYSTGIGYDEGSRIQQEQFGMQTALHHKLHYNVRGQLYDVRLSSVSWAADEWDWNRGALVNYYDANRTWGTSGTDNNGNLRHSESLVPLDTNATYGSGGTGYYASSVQSYGYDTLNRLTSVGEQKYLSAGGGLQPAFTQAYTYDRFGNRTINQGGTTQTLSQEMRKAFAVDAATNRLGVPVGQTGVMSYDLTGNLTTDSYSGAGTRTYDAENRMTSAQGTSVSLGAYTNVYTYDAAGRRTRRKTEGAEVWQVYGLEGELVAEYAGGAAPAAPQKEYGYRNGEMLVVSEGTTTTTTGDSVWVEDALPGGAQTSAGGINEGWNWVTGSPSPASGVSSHRSPATAGLHQQYFQDATATMAVAAGDNLVAFVYLDPASPPTEVMLQWQDGAGSFEHRAYWGANQIGWGVDGTTSRRYLGALPAAGKWVRLEVPATAVGLVGQTVKGLGLTLYGGRANWDRVGKAAPGGPQWLVSDHIGTPRMVADKTGNMPGIKRHDYLPFGEELNAGQGGRTTAQGYAGDNVRQQFTGYERDDETALDYAQARYFSGTQGRFTSVDPLAASAVPDTPQTFNRYTYALNSPLKYTDPSGMISTSMTSACGDACRNSENNGARGGIGGAGTSGGIEEMQALAGPQVVDLRNDKVIAGEIDKIQANATPLPEGQAPELSAVKVVAGKTYTIKNGGFIDGYGSEATGFTGVVRPVAYIPLDQGGNIIQGGQGTAIAEKVRLISGEMPQTSKGWAPAPKGGVFIDIQSANKGSKTTVLEQGVFVGQYSITRTTQFKHLFMIAPNKITKNVGAGQISITLGKPVRRI